MSEPSSGSGDRRAVARILRIDEAALEEAANVLRSGGLVAFPTETVYGLGAAARDPSAVRRIFSAKGRPAHHPLIVHLADAAWLPRWADDVPHAAATLAAAFWPGPLTLVLRRSSAVPDEVTGGADTVGLRVPAHPAALALIERLGDAVAAPSANRFGRISPTRAAHVADELGAAVDLILDGGPSRVGVESTIVDVTTPTPRLLRPGGVPVRALEETLGSRVPDAVGDAPRAPGTLASHYAPRTPTVALTRGDLERRATADDAVLALGAAPEGHRGTWRALPRDPTGAAHALYEAMRSLDAAAPARILIELPPDTPEWRAVRDRILRAATEG